MQIKKEIKDIRESNMSRNRVKLAALKKRLAEAYKNEEIYWSQKARQKWLEEGDKNTNYFHACVAGRRKRNRIGLIQKRDGDWCQDEKEIGAEIIQYFKDIFTSEESQGLDDILNEIPESITRMMNKQLTLSVTQQEVYRGIFSMYPSKSPGPDGMAPIFFQKILLYY
mgnify:CR=1 FL=1